MLKPDEQRDAILQALDAGHGTHRQRVIASACVAFGVAGAAARLGIGEARVKAAVRQVLGVQGKRRGQGRRPGPESDGARERRIARLLGRPV